MMGAQTRKEEMEEEAALFSSDEGRAWWTCDLLAEMLLTSSPLLPGAGGSSGIEAYLYALQDLVDLRELAQPWVRVRAGAAMPASA
jgi:hypothetical protein